MLAPTITVCGGPDCDQICESDLPFPTCEYDGGHEWIAVAITQAGRDPRPKDAQFFCGLMCAAFAIAKQATR